MACAPATTPAIKAQCLRSAATDCSSQTKSLWLPTTAGADLTRGAKIFADNCAVCHAADGKGNREVGAPNLTDRIWLYGPDKKTIMEDIINGRGGVMPVWGGRLDDVTIKALAVYVHTLGGGDQ